MSGNKYMFLSLWIIAFLITGTASEAQVKITTMPNIIVIVPDDLGWGDVGYYGSAIKTPNIDKLAATGVQLDQFYVMPTCTPTRVSFLTGRYPSRYGITGPDYGEVIDQGDPTIASLLAANGYSTHLAGKWHMGSPPYTPLKYGFQTSYGYFDGQIDPYTHEYKQETKLTDRRSWHRNDEYLNEHGHATDLITREAIRVINQQRQQPYFLYVAYSVPHYPLDEPEEWTRQYDDQDLFPSRKLYAASVTHMDAGVGKIIQALEQTKQRENTLVIFLSDNGGQHSWQSETEYRGKYAERPHHVLGNNFPLKGWKGDLYEGGIRVPALVNWPGMLEPGIFNNPVHVSDWLPTILNWIGAAESLQSIPTDGINIHPMLTGSTNANTTRSMYWKTKPATAIRDGNWKLILNHSDHSVELYDLEHDFRETNNLSLTEPEKVVYLRRLMEELSKGNR